MCLVVFAHNVHPKYRLILMANRDEFYDRPTAKAQWWSVDSVSILGGKDLKAGGTWMAIDKKGRIASVTNYRDPKRFQTTAATRGDLTIDFLKNKNSSLLHCQDLLKKSDSYNGFNLLLIEKESVYLNNYEKKIKKINMGVYGLSNALLDSSWPKVKKSKKLFNDCIHGYFSPDDLFSIMQDKEIFKDNDLPLTGLPLEKERAYSSICIRTPEYGTRSTTVIMIDYDHHVRFIEKTYPVGKQKGYTSSFSFIIES